MATIKKTRKELYYARTRKGKYHLLYVCTSGAWGYYPACETFTEAKRKAKYHVLHDSFIEQVAISKVVMINGFEFWTQILKCCQIWTKKDGKFMVGQKSGRAKWVKS